MTLPTYCEMCSYRITHSPHFKLCTGHFFSRKDRRWHTVTLSVRRVTSSHTAVNIRVLLDEILSEWDIGRGEIFAIITDNGSNMVAAFKEQGQLKQDDDCMADTDDEEQNFLDCDEDDDAEFISYNRISCFSHTPQLVVNNFGKVSSFKEVMKHQWSRNRGDICPPQYILKLSYMHYIAICRLVVRRD